MSSSEEDCLDQATQLVLSGMVPLVLRAAIRLDLLEIIAKGGGQLSASEIASQIPTKNTDAPALTDRILRLLASQSILICSDCSAGERRYGLGPMAKYFVKHPLGAPLAPVLMQVVDRVIFDIWYQLDGAILGAGTTAFEMAHGAPFYEYAARDGRFGDVFFESMVSQSKMYMTRLLDPENSYKGFESLKSLADVGGGSGHAVAAITSKYPHITAINFDLPVFIQRAPSHPGVEHKEGDMFESVPKADAIFLKWILHNWDNEHCVKLLKNCYKALPENGKVIAVDAVIPEDIDPDNPTTKYAMELDVAMLGFFGTRAKERSRQEFQALATESGFTGIRFECCVCNLWLMEIYK